MSKKEEAACTIIHNNIMPRLRFLRESFSAMAEREIEDDDKDGTSLYDGAVLALDDIIAATGNVMSILEG
jgi:hypothetical protein